jgi:hypothetical protein
LKPTPARPLQRVLTEDGQLAQWHERMQRENRLTAAVRRMLPRALADRVRVADAAPPVLQLAVPSGAVAAAVRQRSPDLLAGLRREGMHFTQLEVRVQVRTEPLPPEKLASNQYSTIEAAPLRRLAEQLPPGELREAVARLARRGR